MAPRSLLLRWLLLAGALAVALPLSADPRWWWHDRPLTLDGSEKSAPHLVLAHNPDGVDSGPGMFLVWQQRDPAQGDWEIWITGSKTEGCSFCPPVRLTDNDQDDTRPRIAVTTVSGLPGVPFAIQVAFERDGDVVLIQESTRVSSFAGHDTFCGQLALIPPLLDERTLNVQPGMARRPDIAYSGSFGDRAFLVAWEELQAAGGDWDIMVDRDTALDATGYGAAGFPLNLTPHPFPRGNAVLPALTGDMLGRPVNQGVGFSLAFVGETEGEVLFLRSETSGLTWSSDGADPIAPPVDPPAPISQTGPYSVAAAGLEFGPDIDASDTVFGTGAIWNLVGWAPAARSTGEGDVQHWSGRSTVDVGWDPVAELNLVPDTVEHRRTAVAMDFANGPAGAWTFFTRTVAGFPELVSRAGTLNAAAANPVDFDLYPIPPVRPADTSTSGVRALSHCSFNDATFDCTPDRSVGEARDVTAAANRNQTISGEFGKHVAWVDTRTGETEIWYKRTDTIGQFVNKDLSAECASTTEGRLRVRIDRPPGCDDSFPTIEQLERVLVFYGTNSGGIYDNAAAPIEIAASALPTEVVIDGLDLATTYYVLAVPEDQARNTQPADFDPLRDAPSWVSEESIVTPGASSCAPDVAVVECLLVGETCPDPAHSQDGALDFGEGFEVRLLLENQGLLAADNYTATLSADNAMPVNPAGGQITIPRLEAGERRTAVVEATVDPSSPAFACGDSVDLTLVNQAADNGGPWPDAPLASCDFLVGGGDGICENCAAGPDVRVARCDVVEDLCSGASGEGVPDPGERVTLELELLNAGSAPAQDLEGTVDLVWGGAPVAGFGALGPWTLAPGESRVHALTLDVDQVCGDTLDIDVRALRSDAGSYLYPDEPVLCDRLVGRTPQAVLSEFRSEDRTSIPDDGSTVRIDVPARPTFPRRVDRATLRTNANMPAPADMELTLEGPGTPPSLDASPSLVLIQDITDYYNSPAGGPGSYFLSLRDADSSAPGGDGTFFIFRITLEDTQADCETCLAPPPVCLHLLEIPDLDAFNSQKPSGFFIVPPPVDDQRLDVPAFDCPFVSGDRVAGVVPDGNPLTILGINRPSRDLRVRKDLSSVPGDLVVTFTP